MRALYEESWSMKATYDDLVTSAIGFCAMDVEGLGGSLCEVRQVW